MRLARDDSARRRRRTRARAMRRAPPPPDDARRAVVTPMVPLARAAVTHAPIGAGGATMGAPPRFGGGAPPRGGPGAIGRGPPFAGGAPGGAPPMGGGAPFGMGPPFGMGAATGMGTGPPPMGGRPTPGQFRGMAITHPSGLSPDLLRMFAPRAPLKWCAPPAKPKKTQRMQGVAACVKEFETASKTATQKRKASKKRNEDADEGEIEVDEDDDGRKPSGVYVVVTKEERAARKRAAAERKSRELIEAGLDGYRPNENPNATSDPYRTLFIARLAYDVDEDKLRREAEYYGAVSDVKLVRDEKGKSRGYAFIEFEREGDMRAAYRGMDDRRIEDRRVIADVERGRTNKGWLPRRLGGGVGRTRAGSKRENVEARGRDRTYDDRRERERREMPRSPPRSPPRGGRAAPPPPRSPSSEEEGELGERAPAPPPPPEDRRRDRSPSRDRHDDRYDGRSRGRFGDDRYDRDRYRDRDGSRERKRGRDSRSPSPRDRRDKRDRRDYR